MPYRDAELHAVVETHGYLADAKHAGMDEADRVRVVDHLAANPMGGDLIQGTGGVRKVRIAREGGGKSGGFRVLTAYFDEDNPVFLLGAFAKNERSNISKASRNALAKVMEELKAKIRQGRE